MRIIRKIISFTLFFAISFSFLGQWIELRAAEAETLVLHYYRFDGDYTGWNVWLWPNEPVSGGGSAYDFTGEDAFGKVLTVSLADTNLEGSTRIGFIIRLGNWDAKDTDIDRFIDLDNPNENGEVHVYIVQNNQTVFYDLAEADISHKILSAAFANENTVQFSLTRTISASDITLYANDVLVPISNVSFSGNNGTLTIAESADLTKRYRLEVDFGDPEVATASVGFDGFYNSDAFNTAYGYDGELGAIYTQASTTFRLWAPISDEVTLNLYTKGHRLNELDYDDVAGVNDPYETHEMLPIEKGVWEITINGDLDGVYYTYSVRNGLTTSEVVDPYAKSSGINGRRGMVVNFEDTNPDGWVYGERPGTTVNYTDAIIYEIHVRDYTTHATWNGNEAWRGKFLGLTQRGTTHEGYKTGLDHILELGVTHVQFVPIFDHGIIDETRLNDPSYYGIHDGIFNWGYMPENFNVLEGSYATDPYNGHVRINEFKQMIKAFHDNDVRVIKDVVYNHTGRSADSNFDLILPGYYFRMNANGTFSNGSGTGNETASERYMFRKFMVDSLLFYTQEYNLDGYRFDLMKLHDVDTMNAIVDALHEIDPSILVFGEPWTGGTSPLRDQDAAFNSNLDRMPGVGVFNDDTRDGIKGSVFSAGDKGFIQGNNFADARVNLGIAGATAQPNLSTGALPKGAWAVNPTQNVNYVTAHDNNTLYDKLFLSTFETLARITDMQRQANAIVLTSQGIAFLHGGVEILRTKPCVPVPAGLENTCDSANRFDHNSYKSPDETNQIDWQWKVDHYDTFVYYQRMIELRKMKSVFRLATAEEVSEHLFLIPDTISGFVSFFLSDPEDEWKTIYILFNNGAEEREITLQEGTWHVVATIDEIGEITESTYGGQTVPTLETLYMQEGGETITMAPNGTLIMYSLETVTYSAPQPETPDDDSPSLVLPIVLGSTVLVLGPLAYFFIRKKRLTPIA
ncbi:MAG: type I pullulanase, partial [Acholeplasmataceae bacterium]